MKKKVLAVVSACMLVMLAACGNADSKPEVEGNPDVTVNEDVNVDMEQDASGDAQQGDKQESADSEPVVEGPVVYTAKQEILDAEWHSGMLQVNDKLIQLPVSLSELLAMGFDYVVDNGRKNKDYLFANEERINYTLLLDGEEICHSSLWYTGDRLATLEEINPKVESIDYFSIKETKLTFFLPGGVTLNDTMQAVEEKLGEPLEMNPNQNIFTYTYGRPSKDIDQCEFGVKVNVGRDSQTVTGFKVARSLVPSKYEDFSANTIVSVKNIQSDDMHDVQVLLPKEHLYTVNNVMFRNAETVFEKDDAFYWMKLEFGGTLQKYFNQFELQTSGTLLYEDTDENGVSRKVYDSGVVYCFKAPFVMTIRVNMAPISKTDADVTALYQDYLVELGKTVQY